MIVAVPVATAVTIPDIDPTDAIAVLLLLHVPPVVALISVVLLPLHTLSVPDIGAM